jgi:phage FluMu protein Com
MQKTLDLKCWKCQEVFSFTTQIASGEAPDNKVEVIKPCPFCETNNRFTLREDEINTITLHKGAGKENSTGFPQPEDPFWEQIFTGKPPAA